MASNYQYPIGVPAGEQPLWLQFYTAPYSLQNNERTRPGVINRAEFIIKMPLPKEPGYMIPHEYGESNNNPVAPILSSAGLANSGNILNLVQRTLQPATFYWERMFATTTYRRFSNVGEMTMISEGRKRYVFQYIMVPKSEAESQQVEEIAGTFRKCSYPSVASGLPERSYPQNLWALQVVKGNAVALGGEGNLTANWLGEPLVCVLDTVFVHKNDASDPIVRYLPNGASSVTILGLVFTEFETGTYVPEANAVWSKSEISTYYFGASS